MGEDGSAPSEFAAELLHGFLEMVQLLGRRLGELHCALASAPERPEFAPEPISLQYQRAIFHFTEVIGLMQHRPGEPIVSESERYISLSKRRLQAAELFP